jgi:hypothetical protein
MMTFTDDRQGGHPLPRVQLDRFPGGKLPAQPGRKQLRFASFTPALPAPPDTQDWLSQVTDWPMYGNDRLGDCVEACACHQIEQFTQYGQGKLVKVNDQTPIDLYSAVAGYVPGDPSTDQGTYVQDMLAYWRKSGVAGHQIVAYASLDVGNLTQVKQAIAIFGSACIGFNFPRSAMDQFNQGRPWDVVAGDPLDGGHCVLVGAYDQTYLDTVTWGATQRMTYPFWRKYVDEAWVIITQEWVNATTKRSPQGFDLYTLGQDFAVVTGEANPIPAPAPSPVPTVDDRTAGDALWHATQAWTEKPHARCNAKAARAVQQWARDTGRA